MSLSGKEIIYTTWSQPGWIIAIQDYRNAVNQAAIQIAWMKEKNWCGYHFHKHEFGVEAVEYTNVFEKANTPDMVREKEIRIIQDYVIFLLHNLGNKLKAHGWLDQESKVILVEHLIQKATDTSTGRILELCSARLDKLFKRIYAGSEGKPRFPKIF